MPGRKYLKIGTGGALEEEASIQASAGAGDAGKVVALDAAGKLDTTMMPTGFGDDVKTMVASEALTAGDFVNIWSDAGTGKIRKADATTAGKEADGFVLAAVASGASGLVYFEGNNNQRTGLTPGAVYFLATTAGGCTTTPPAAAGNVVQRLGRAISATEISFEQGLPMTRA